MDWPSFGLAVVGLVVGFAWICWPSLVWELAGLAVVGLAIVGLAISLGWPFGFTIVGWPSLGWPCVVVGLAWIGRLVCLDWPSESVTCQTLGVRHVLLKSQFVINR